MAMTVDKGSSTVDVPFAMHDPLHVPAERYLDRAFFELEKEKLWPHVWQMACRLEEIPDVGDFVEYEICDQSILVVREGPDTIKAFQNACRHRATQLAKGAGRFPGGPAAQIVCPFHGWRWNLDGTSSFVFGEQGFAPECMRPDDLRLRECLVDTWGGCVFVNLDRDAPPLLEALAPVPQLLDPLGVDRMRVWWWKETILNANWKMAQEAFLEGYHTMRTHPQLTMGQGEEWDPFGICHEVYPNGHSQFMANRAGAGASPTPEQFIESLRLLWEGMDAMVLERDLHLFESLRHDPAAAESPAAAAIAALYRYAAGAGIPLPQMAPEDMARWGGEVFAFPNYFVLPQFGNALVYRIRPHGDDPEQCRFEVWSLTMYPEGQEPGRAQLRGRFAPDDAENWGLIPRQDFSNIERQQRGLHSRDFTGLRLSGEWERGISNMHEELDRYLAR